jgi:hypothetical protein
MVSGSISLPSPGFFSPFPHGTRSLSVIRWYLALEGGPPSFPQGSTCLVVLRIPLRFPHPFAYGPVTPFGCPFQNIRLLCGVPTCAVLQPRPQHTTNSDPGPVTWNQQKNNFFFYQSPVPGSCLLCARVGLGYSLFARRYWGNLG